MFIRTSVGRDVWQGRVVTRILKVWRSRRELVVAGMISACCGLLFIACSDNGELDVVEQTTSVLEGVEIVETPEDSIEVEVDDPRSRSGPRRGGVLQVPSGNFLLPDPALFSPSSVIEPLLGEIYSGLMQLTDDPNDALRADLAERYEVRDGTKYEFVLKRDLKFSDGSPVTASDFKWSWERALNPSTGSRHAAEVFGLVVGAADVLSGSSEELVGVEAVDDRTLLVTLSEPSAAFPFFMADPVAAVLKRENVDNWKVDFSDPLLSPSSMTFEELPAGTGPFKLLIYDVDHMEFVLARNEYYHEGPSFLEGVVYVTDLFEQKDGRMVLNLDPAFEEGRIDWTFGSTRNAKNEFGGEIVTMLSGNRSDFLIFNSALPPYDDLSFRQALIGSVDLGAHHGEGQKHEIPGSLIPPLLTGHDPDLAGIGHDPMEAAANLERSKYADEVSSIRLTFHTEVDDVFGEEFEYLSQSWSDVLGTGEGRYSYTRSDLYDEMLMDGEIEMVFKDVYARYPDGLAVLSELFQVFGTGNSSKEHSELDRMIQSAKAESDAAARLDTYSDIQRFVLEQALVMPFEWPSSAGSGISLQPWVHGYREPVFHGSRFKDVWFDENAPNRELPVP